MPPKRKGAGGRGKGRGANKKAKTSGDNSAVERLLSAHDSYCEELGIDIADGGSAAAFQWLSCSIVFGQRLSEKTTVRAAKGLLKSGLTDAKSVRNSDQWEKIEALNSEGNVQRGPSMASRLEATAAHVLDKYDGDLDNLREAAGKKPEEIRKLVKEFKGFGDMAVSIFCREVQLQWEELFPFADERTLEMAGKHGLPSGSADELAELVGNDRAKFVRLLAAVVKAELRGDKSGADGNKEGGDDASKKEGRDDDEKKDDAAQTPAEADKGEGENAAREAAGNGGASSPAVEEAEGDDGGAKET